MRWTALALGALFFGNMARAQSGEDALSLLERVTAHYRNAESIHLEATAESTGHDAYYDSRSLRRLSVSIAPGERFRYEGEDSSGSGLIVSDGTTEWRLMRSFGEYSQAPTGTYFRSRMIYMGDNSPIINARSLLQGITYLDGNLRSAHYGPPETLDLGGRKVRCTVVHFGPADSTLPAQEAARVMETTLWIDPVSLTIVKQQDVGHNRHSFGARVPPFAREIEVVNTTIYSVSEIDTDLPAGIFTFQPPAGSREVAELPSPFPENQRDPAADAAAEARKHDAAMIGKMLPSLTLNDAAGHALSLENFKGHPVLIDIWATWCAPCLLDLPALEKIRVSMKGTGLAFLPIDEDSHAEDAAALLKRRGYDWTGYHYSHDLIRALDVKAIPVTILADAQGRIVYYRTGADDQALASAIASLGLAFRQVSIR